MFESFVSRGTLIFLSTTIAVLTVACRDNRDITTTDGKEPQGLHPRSGLTAKPTTTPVASPALSPELPSKFEQGLDKAASAFSISQSAQSIEDWNLVVRQFQDAIALMEEVPVNSPYFSSAQTKILEFQHLLQYAQKHANPIVKLKAKPERNKLAVVVPQVSGIPKSTPPLPEKPISCELHSEESMKQCSPPSQKEKVSLSSSILPQPELLNKHQEVFKAPIKRRIGGTPIIEVTFNGNQQFEMILDTGASGTVITQSMATSLGVMPVGKAKANTVSSKAVEFPVGYVDSIEVGGARVNQIAVAIAGADLETGLLGHDFFGEYDLTIKRDVVEFRPQSSFQKDSPQTTPTSINTNRIR